MKKILAAVPLLGIGLSMSSVTWADEHEFGGHPAGVDQTTSLGKFTIKLDKKVKEQLEDDFGIILPSRTFVSPTLSDASTQIGRSDAHTNGSDADNDPGPGAEVCQKGTNTSCDKFFPDTVKDDDFSEVPTIHKEPGPDNTREVHTQIVTFHLTDKGEQCGNMTANAVRAGKAAPDQPRSIGEVKSRDPAGNPDNDFPADSFFNVFVEVDVDINGDDNIDITLFNKKPLLIQGELNSFPPNVLYVHGGTENRVVMFNKANDERIGVLRLAGHGIGKDYRCDPESVAAFEHAYANSVELDYFTATAGNGAVALEWATGTEKDNAGFKVWRAQPLDGKCSDNPNNYTDVQAITPLVASQGTEVSGATYTMTDSGAVSGNTYCYALEDIDYDGKSTFHMKDIVSAKP